MLMLVTRRTENLSTGLLIWVSCDNAVANSDYICMLTLRPECLTHMNIMYT